jgi:hypothetical protein
MAGNDPVADIDVVTDTARMKTFVIAAMLLTFPVCANAAQTECRSPLGAAVPDVATARAIATAVISARQTTEISKKYRLFVEPDSERAGSWMASQALPQPRNRDPKTIVLIRGGGGMQMRIDRCTGEISDMYYSR